MVTDEGDVFERAVLTKEVSVVIALDQDNGAVQVSIAIVERLS